MSVNSSLELFFPLHREYSNSFNTFISLFSFKRILNFPLLHKYELERSLAHTVNVILLLTYIPVINTIVGIIFLSLGDVFLFKNFSYQTPLEQKLNKALIIRCGFALLGVGIVLFPIDIIGTIFKQCLPKPSLFLLPNYNQVSLGPLPDRKVIIPI